MLAQKAHRFDLDALDALEESLDLVQCRLHLLPKLCIAELFLTAQQE